VSPIEPANPALAAAIARFREDRELTQEDVAYRAGITTSTFSRIETGLSNPTWSTVERIARALDVSLVEIAKAVESYED
jgi:transcriptional regulator with XRE-family HTH domain